MRFEKILSELITWNIISGAGRVLF